MPAENKSTSGKLGRFIFGVLITAGAPGTSTQVESQGSGSKATTVTSDRVAGDFTLGLRFKEKMRFQSFFMLITTQAFFVALLRSSSENVPTAVSGRCTAGP